MNIEFPGPAVHAQDGGVSYRALVDGKTVACQFTLEALEDADPSRSMADALTLFEFNKARLLAIAEAKIRAGKVAEGAVQIFTRDL